MRVLPRSLLLAALCAAGLPVLAASAPAPVDYNFGVTIRAYDPSLTERDFFSDPVPLGQEASYRIHTGSSSATTTTRLDADGATRASYGRLQSAASTSVFVNSTNDDGFSSAWVSPGGFVGDQFVVTCPTCQDGTTGTLTARVRVEGTLGAEGGFTVPSTTADVAVSASRDFHVSLAAQGVAPANGEAQLDGHASRYLDNGTFVDESSGDGLGWHTLSVSFVFGRPIELDLGIALNAYVFIAARDDSGVSAAASAWADFSHSLTWEGITAITGADGQAITGFTALNAAGVDYARAFAAPVPEPGTWALMAAGLGLLGARGRRRGA